MPTGIISSCRNEQQSKERLQYLYYCTTKIHSFFPYIFSLSVFLQEIQKHNRKKLYLLFTYFIALQFKKLKLHRNSVLGWRNHLPHTIFIRRVLLGPTWSGYGAIKFGKKSTTSRQKKRKGNNFSLTKSSQHLPTDNPTSHH